MQGTTEATQLSAPAPEARPYSGSDFGDAHSRPLELLLTHEQFKQLQKLLPGGYSLAVSNKSTRLPIKKLASKEDIRDDNNTASGSNQQRTRRTAHREAKQTIEGNGELVRKWGRIIGLLKKHRCSEPFLRPVDPIALRIPDYPNIVKEPMDLSTVERKLFDGEYATQAEVEADIGRIWANAFLYNMAGTQIYKMTEDMSSYFDKLLTDDQAKPDASGHLKQQVTKVAKRVSDYESGNSLRGAGGKNPPAANKAQYDKPLSYAEKKNLSQMIRQLPSESLWDVWKIVSPDNQNHGNEELEFDIDTLPVKTARDLESFVRSKVSMINRKKNPQKKAGSMAELPAQAGYAGPTSGAEGSPTANNNFAASPADGNAEFDAKAQPNARNGNRDDSESSFISDLDESDY